MTHRAWPIVAAALVVALPAAAESVAPERAPPAQQAAPPDKIGPPLHAKQVPAATIRRPETTGAAPKALEPGHGDDAATPEKLDKDAPSR